MINGNPYGGPPSCFTNGYMREASRSHRVNKEATCLPWMNQLRSNASRNEKAVPSICPKILGSRTCGGRPAHLDLSYLEVKYRMDLLEDRNAPA